MLRCNEVSRRFASDEHVDTGWYGRLMLRLHMLMCSHCRRYAQQLGLLGRAARRIRQESGAHDPASVERLEQKVRETHDPGSRSPDREAPGAP